MLFAELELFAEGIVDGSRHDQRDGEGQEETLNKEDLIFENVKLTQRSYK